MKSIHMHRKPISMFVMITFTILLCFWANQAPAAPATGVATPEDPASTDSEAPKSAIEEEIEKVEAGPDVPPIEDEEEDLFK